MKRSDSIIAVCLLSFLFSEPSYAYLDPGTGGMLIQILLGGLAGLAVAGKLFWHQLKSFFHIRRDDEPEADSDDT